MARQGVARQGRHGRHGEFYLQEMEMIMSMEDLKNSLDELKDENGRITPFVVVEAARDETHELHEYFTWDNREAAEKWRLDEARKLIRSVKISVILDDDRTILTPYFVHDATIQGEQGYIPINMITDEISRHRVILRELNCALGSLERVKEIAQALNHKKTIAEVSDRIRQVKAEIQAAA